MSDRLMQVHIRESDTRGGRPLYEVIVDTCRELGIAGATVFRGVEGYGSAAEIHRAHLLTHDLPVVVTVVDSEENVARAAAAIEAMLEGGAIAIEPVTARRVRQTPVLP
jgi:PII-like signaling protein